MPETPPLLINLRETASKLGVPVAWLKQEATSGKLPCIRVGRRLMFDLEIVKRALSARQEGVPHA